MLVVAVVVSIPTTLLDHSTAVQREEKIGGS